MQNLFRPTTLLLLSKRVRSNLVRTHTDEIPIGRIGYRVVFLADTTCVNALYFFTNDSHTTRCILFVNFNASFGVRCTRSERRLQRDGQGTRAAAPGPRSAERFLMTRNLISYSYYYYEAVFHQNLFLLPEMKLNTIYFGNVCVSLKSEKTRTIDGRLKHRRNVKKYTVIF